MLRYSELLQVCKYNSSDLLEIYEFFRKYTCVKYSGNLVTKVSKYSQT